MRWACASFQYQTRQRPPPQSTTIINRSFFMDVILSDRSGPDASTPSGDSSSTRPSWRRMTRSATSKYSSSWLMTSSALPAALISGSSLCVEDLLERRVLVGGPFVEDAERAGPPARRRAGPAASSGPARGRAWRTRPSLTETSVASPSRSSPSRAGSSIAPAVEAAQVAEEMAVGEDDREELAIRLGRRASSTGAAVEPDDARLGTVEAREQLDQGRLAAAVAPGQDDDLAAPERQVERAEREAAVVGRRRGR